MQDTPTESKEGTSVDQTEYVPVDTSFAARYQWPLLDYFRSTKDLNGREFGQFILGTMHGRALHGERAFMLHVDPPRLAALVAALVDGGWAVSKESWSDECITIFAWSGM